MSDDAVHIPARDHRQRSCAVPCEPCDAWTELTFGAPDVAPLAHIPCRQCGASQALDWAGHLDAAGTLDGCPRCDYHTLCIQKDVNPRLGVVLVTLTFAALLFSGLSIPQMLVGLVALAALDWCLLRLLVKRLLICYRCKAQFRGFPPGERCRPFDLSTWEAHTPPRAG